MRKLISTIILLATILTIHAAEKPIKIGISLGLTGKYTLVSKTQQNAYLMWADEINAKGGILKRPVELIILDNESSATIAVRQYEELITKSRVDIVFGPYSSELTAAIAPVVEKYQYPTLAAGASADAIWMQGHKNIFGMWTPASRYVLNFLKLLTSEDINDIAIVTADSSFGTSIAEGAEKWGRILRFNIKHTQTFTDNEKDLSELAKTLQAKQPQVVICTGHYRAGEALKTAFKSINWHPKIFFASVSPTFQKYYDKFGEGAENDFSTAIWEPHPKLKIPKSLAFSTRYKKRYKLAPTYHAASAYAAGEVLEKALQETKSLDRSKMRKALGELNTITILGRYAVDKTGIQLKRFPLIIQWQDKKKEIVWPIGLQTAKPRFAK